MSMPHAVRHINKIRTLDALFRTGQMSRSDLARKLGVTRSTASSIVSDLVQERMVIEDEGEPVDRGVRTGRPGVYLRLRGAHSIFLGAEIGVGSLRVVAIDLAAKVVHQRTKLFDLERAIPEAVVSELVALIRAVIHRLPEPNALRGLNVTVPGLLDREGQIFRAPMLRWADVPLLPILRGLLPRISAIEAENDANAFAMAELYRARTSAPGEEIYMFLDAGVGGALMRHGQLLRGYDGFAGEVGHIFVGDEGFVAMGFLPGSLESFVGREAILARCTFHGGMVHSIEEFIAALSAESPSAIATVRDWSQYLGRGLATLTSVFNPARIVLGGPIAALFRFGEPDVMASMRRRLLPSQPLPAVELSPLGAEGPAIGAAAIMHRRMLSFDEDLVFNGVRGQLGSDATARSLEGNRKRVATHHN